jgi:hypothetical protein
MKYPMVIMALGIIMTLVGCGIMSDIGNSLPPGDYKVADGQIYKVNPDGSMVPMPLDSPGTWGTVLVSVLTFLGLRGVGWASTVIPWIHRVAPFLTSLFGPSAKANPPKV